MNRAFSNTVIHSSNVEEKYSSEEGDDIVDLSGNELKKCLIIFLPMILRKKK